MIMVLFRDGNQHDAPVVGRARLDASGKLRLSGAAKVVAQDKMGRNKKRGEEFLRMLPRMYDNPYFYAELVQDDDEPVQKSYNPSEPRDEDGKWTRGGKTVATVTHEYDRNLDVIRPGNKVSLLRPNGKVHKVGVVQHIDQADGKVLVAVEGEKDIVWPLNHVERIGSMLPPKAVQAKDKKGNVIHAGDMASLYKPNGDWIAWGKIVAVNPQGRVDFRMIQGQKGVSVLAVHGNGPDLTGLESSRFELEEMAPNIQGTEGFANHGEAEARHPELDDAPKVSSLVDKDGKVLRYGDSIEILPTDGRELPWRDRYGRILRIDGHSIVYADMAGMSHANVPASGMRRLDSSADIPEMPQEGPKTSVPVVRFGDNTGRKYRNGDVVRLNKTPASGLGMSGKTGTIVSFLGEGRYRVQFGANIYALHESDFSFYKAAPAPKTVDEYKAGDRVMMAPDMPTSILYGYRGEVGHVLAVMEDYPGQKMYRVDFPEKGDRAWINPRNLVPANTQQEAEAPARIAAAKAKVVEEHKKEAERKAAAAEKRRESAKKRKEDEKNRYRTTQTDPLAPPSIAAIEQEILEGTIDPNSYDGLGGGNVNKVLSADLTASNGEHVQVVIKAQSGLSRKKYRQGITVGYDLERERATYVVNNALDELVEMPEYVIRDVPGKGRAGVQVLKDDTDGVLAGNYGVRLGKFRDATRRLALLDTIIGNFDRHGGNIMVRPKDKEHPLVAIDHGLTFPDDTQGDQWINANAIDAASGWSLKDDELHRLDAMWSKYDAVTDELKPLLPQKSIDAMWRRVNWMREEKLIPSVDDFNEKRWDGYPATPAEGK